MKHSAIVLACVALVGFATPAFSDHIGIYNDGAGTSCFLNVSPPAIVTAFVVHIYTVDATGSAFRVVDLSQMVPLEQAPLDILTVGDPFVGVEAAYGQCIYGHIPVLRLVFYAASLPFECESKLRVESHPNYAGITVSDCSNQLKPATGGEFVFGLPVCTSCSANATSEKTWGAVKALYQ